MKLIDAWTVIIILSNLFHFFGLIFVMIPADILPEKEIDVLMGLGTFLIYLSLLKYFQYSQDYYIIPATMISAGKIIMVAAITSLPMIIGLAFFCIT